MLGFGALRAMNDTMKQNRDLLKANKKKPFEKGAHTKISDNLLHNDKKLSETERIKLVQATWRSNREETRRQLLVLVISIGVVVIMVYTFITWWHRLG